MEYPLNTVQIRCAALLALAGCAAPSATPRFAVDTLWTEPATDRLHGYQTWTLYSENWERKYRERFHVCSIVVEFQALPISTEDCEACSSGWATSTSLLDSDCPNDITERDGWLDLRRIAVGPVPDSLLSEDPRPGRSLAAYADYGDQTWTEYGWAFTERLQENPNAEWSISDIPDTTPFAFQPAAYWDLGPVGSDGGAEGARVRW